MRRNALRRTSLRAMGPCSLGHPFQKNLRADSGGFSSVGAGSCGVRSARDQLARRRGS